MNLLTGVACFVAGVVAAVVGRGVVIVVQEERIRRANRAIIAHMPTATQAAYRTAMGGGPTREDPR